MRTRKSINVQRLLSPGLGLGTTEAEKQKLGLEKVLIGAERFESAASSDH